MSQAVKRKIVVFGGTGFVGSRICHAATQRSWDVTSLSRTGTPHWPSITSTPSSSSTSSSSSSSSSTPPPWSTSVTWARADILDPSSYAAALAGADAVVHSLGILLESDYKAVLAGTESVGAAVRRMFGAAERRGLSANPLDETAAGNNSSSSSGSGGGAENGSASGTKDRAAVTYELVNRDSAIILAREAARAGIKTLVYVSAAAGAPGLPRRYITTKRAAESTITKHFGTSLRSVYMRAPFLYDESRAFTLPIAAAARVASALDVGGVVSGVLGSAAVKPMRADGLAEAIVEAIEDESVRGPVLPEQIETLVTKAWRKGML